MIGKPIVIVQFILVSCVLYIFDRWGHVNIKIKIYTREEKNEYKYINMIIEKNDTKSVY